MLLKNNFNLKLPIIFVTAVLVLSACSSRPTDGGIFLSTDDGTNWVQRNQLAESLSLGRQNVTVIKKQSENNIWVGTEEVGLWRTQDLGQSWINELTSAGLIRDIQFAGQGNQLVLVSVTNGLYRRASSEAEWEFIFIDPSPVSALMVFPNQNIVIAGTQSGKVLVSSDNGKNWNLAFNTESEIVDLVSNGSSTALLMTANKGLYISENQGSTWSQVELDEELDGILSAGSLAFGDGQYWYGSKAGLFVSRDGQNFRQIQTLLEPDTELIRSIYVTPQEIIFTAQNRIYSSLDEGSTWQVDVVPSSRSIVQFLVTEQEGQQVWFAGLHDLGQNDSFLIGL